MIRYSAVFVFRFVCYAAAAFCVLKCIAILAEIYHLQQGGFLE